MLNTPLRLLETRTALPNAPLTEKIFNFLLMNLLLKNDIIQP
ncbi:hypothetical protein [Oscillatoria salina]|nr:hypothetical protein [Oscillatoria salina]